MKLRIRILKHCHPWLQRLGAVMTSEEVSVVMIYEE
jgi:hypothetical protein